jgi:hypothetical protein
MIDITGPHKDGTMRVHFRGGKYNATLLQRADTLMGKAILECMDAPAKKAARKKKPTKRA